MANNKTGFLAWKQTKSGLLISGTVELILAYLIGSRALDTGSYWQYLLAVILFIGAVQSYIRTFKNHGKN